jgi:phage shock protein PspC (stress-responsive transcriptional regulator)
MQKKLYRNVNNKMLAGVCSGLADYLNIDATLVRLLVVLIALFAGTGVLFYIICAIIIPPAPDAQNAVPPVYTQQPPVYAPPNPQYQPPVAPPEQPTDVTPKEE